MTSADAFIVALIAAGILIRRKLPQWMEEAKLARKEGD